MNHPYLLIIALTLLGFILPELLLIFKIRVGFLFNGITTIIAFLLAYSFIMP